MFFGGVRKSAFIAQSTSPVIPVCTLSSLAKADLRFLRRQESIVQKIP